MGPAILLWTLWALAWGSTLAADIISDGPNLLPLNSEYFLYHDLKSSSQSGSDLLNIPLQLSPGSYRFSGLVSTVGFKCTGVGVNFKFKFKDLDPQICATQEYTSMRKKRAAIPLEGFEKVTPYLQGSPPLTNLYNIPIPNDDSKSFFSTIVTIDGETDREVEFVLIAEAEAWLEESGCVNADEYPMVSIGHLSFSRISGTSASVSCGNSLISFDHKPMMALLAYRFGKANIPGAPEILSSDTLFFNQPAAFKLNFVIPVNPRGDYVISLRAVFPTLMSVDTINPPNDYYYLSVMNLKLSRKIIPSATPADILLDFTIDSQSEIMIVSFSHQWLAGGIGDSATPVRIEEFKVYQLCDMKTFAPRSIRFPYCALQKPIQNFSPVASNDEKPTSLHIQAVETSTRVNPGNQSIPTPTDPKLVEEIARQYTIVVSDSYFDFGIQEQEMNVGMKTNKTDDEP